MVKESFPRRRWNLSEQLWPCPGERTRVPRRNLCRASKSSQATSHQLFLDLFDWLRKLHTPKLEKRSSKPCLALEKSPLLICGCFFETEPVTSSCSCTVFATTCGRLERIRPKLFMLSKPATRKSISLLSESKSTGHCPQKVCLQSGPEVRLEKKKRNLENIPNAQKLFVVMVKVFFEQNYRSFEFSCLASGHFRELRWQQCAPYSFRVTTVSNFSLSRRCFLEICCQKKHQKRQDLLSSNPFVCNRIRTDKSGKAFNGKRAQSCQSFPNSSDPSRLQTWLIVGVRIPNFGRNVWKHRTTDGHSFDAFLQEDRLQTNHRQRPEPDGCIVRLWAWKGVRTYPNRLVKFEPKTLAN